MLSVGGTAVKHLRLDAVQALVTGTEGTTVTKKQYCYIDVGDKLMVYTRIVSIVG